MKKKRINCYKKNEKKINSLFELFLVAFLGALFCSIGNYLVQYSLKEKNAEIKTSYEILNNSVEFRLHNDMKISASEITFFGIVNGVEKELGILKSTILTNEEDLYVKIPIKYIDVFSEMDVFDFSLSDGIVKFSIPDSIIKENFFSNDLFYRIECDTCRNSKDDWKKVTVEELEYKFKIKKIEQPISLFTFKKPVWDI